MGRRAPNAAVRKIAGLLNESPEMKVRFLLARRVPPVPSPVLVEVERLLRHRGYRVDGETVEEVVQRLDRVRVEADLYVVKSHTELTLSVAGVLDAKGALTLNPYHSCQTAQDKIQVSARLDAADLPVPRSWVTGCLDLLTSLVDQHPLVVKPHRGHRGAGVVIARDAAALASIPPLQFPVIVQEFIDGPAEDLKVYVVGDQVFAVRKPFTPDSFTQPGRPVQVNQRLRDIAMRVGDVLGLGLYGMDVVESDRGPVIVDVNYFPGYKGVSDVAFPIADYIDRYARGEIALPISSRPFALSTS
jgi:ribosomal protein S6--L-glutamate ligase